eukprot:5198769-Heterocapsa_arctica.AAC.1
MVLSNNDEVYDNMSFNMMFHGMTVMGGEEGTMPAKKVRHESYRSGDYGQWERRDRRERPGVLSRNDLHSHVSTDPDVLSYEREVDRLIQAVPSRMSGPRKGM